MQARCAIDDTIRRVEINGFKFPLGVYPVEPMEPRAGYSLEFEPADSGEIGGDFVEEWPDRYVFDIVVGADRLEALFRQLVPILPGRVYPILDFIGHDAYREIDPYISRSLIGTDWLLDGVRACRPFFFEDGMCGFGALSDDPFMHLVVDEHKIITIRCESDRREKIERVLAAFDLKEIEDPAGADAAAHEHRNILWTPEDRPDLLGAEEIVEDLRDAWQLDLNVDITRNIDDEGRELGVTPWRCLIRNEAGESTRYAEVVVTADCLLHAEELAYDATIGLLAGDASSEDIDPVIVIADRMTPTQLEELLQQRRAEGVPGVPGERGTGADGAGEEMPGAVGLAESRVLMGRWLG